KSIQTFSLNQHRLLPVNLIDIGMAEERSEKAGFRGNCLLRKDNLGIFVCILEAPVSLRSYQLFSFSGIFVWILVVPVFSATK
ncbi:MAG: hypothetical protein ACI3Z8_04125, partial [Paludibacteraceae bacterium]